MTLKNLNDKNIDKELERIKKAEQKEQELIDKLSSFNADEITNEFYNNEKNLKLNVYKDNRNRDHLKNHYIKSNKNED